MKLNRTREQWLEHRNGNQTGRDDFYDCVWDVIRLYDEVSKLKKENEKMRELEDRVAVLEDRLNKILYNDDTEIRLKGVIKVKNMYLPTDGYELNTETGEFVFVGIPKQPRKVSWLSKLFGDSNETE